MDWLRRNWPDLLIGIALVAVIAGIIATLITGGSFFPVGQNTQTNTPPAQSSTAQTPAQPATPSASTSSPSTSSTPSTASPSSPAGSSSSTSASTGSSGTGSGNTSTATSGSSGTSASAPSSGGVSVLPPGGSGSGASSAGASAPAGGSSTASSGGSAAAASSPASSGPAPAPSTSASAAAPATSSSGPGAAAPYRISVGAFSHPDYAKRREQVFTKAGYPAFLASQGDLTIVLVGPYRTLKEADAVASRIKGGGFGVDPVVYQFKGSSDSAPPPASPSAGGSATSSTSSGSTAAASSSSTASAGQRYLQVGAYDTAASAKPQRDRLTAMGYQVTEKTEGGLVKLLIGPFGSAKLRQVQGQLKAAGIDSFPR